MVCRYLRTTSLGNCSARGYKNASTGVPLYAWAFCTANVEMSVNWSGRRMNLSWGGVVGLISWIGNGTLGFSEMEIWGGILILTFGIDLI